MLPFVGRIFKYNVKRQVLCMSFRNNVDLVQQNAGLCAKSDEDGEKILLTLNNKNFEQLSAYDITKTRATKLLAWRARNGPLRKLEDILLIEGFSVKTAEKLYCSIVSDDDAQLKLYKSSRNRIAQFVTPTVEDGQRARLRSCIAMRIGVTSVSWARLQLPENSAKNAPCLLTHWQHHEIAEKKLHLSDLVQRCLYVNRQIPLADCYLLESPQMIQQSSNPGSIDQQNVSIQKSQVTAIIGYALAARQTETNRPNVFYLKRFLAARLFNHLVGTERVSSEHMMLQLMRTYYNMEDMLDETTDSETPERISVRGNVHFPQNFRHMFDNADRYHREFLSQALLLNLTFVRLILLKDEESIASVLRNPNKEKNAGSGM